MFDMHISLFILCIWVFCLHVCLYTTYIQCPQRSEEGVRSPGTEFFCGSLEQSPGPPVLLTAKHSLRQETSFLLHCFVHVAREWTQILCTLGNCSTTEPHPQPQCKHPRDITWNRWLPPVSLSANHCDYNEVDDREEQNLPGSWKRSQGHVTGMANPQEEAIVSQGNLEGMVSAEGSV